MDRRHTPTQDTQTSISSAERRRVRSISQPGPSYAHTSGPSRPSENPPLMGAAAVPDPHFADSFDFDFLSTFGSFGDQQGSASTPAPAYDEAAFQRALLAFQQQSPFNTALSHSMPTPPPTVPSMPNLPSMSNMPNVPNMPNLPNLANMPNMPAPSTQNPTQAFLAALPWLQLMYQMQQNQYTQPMQQASHQVPFMQQPQPQHHQQQAESQPQPHAQPRRTTSSRPESPWDTAPNPFSLPQPNQAVESPASSSAGAPSPPQQAEVPEDPVAIAEDKRRRNTAASARFRIKKKQWSLNLERTISDLSSRVQELEVEAAELRRENGWLKEIVMLKSKQNAQAVAAGEAGTSASASSSQPDLTDPSAGGNSGGPSS
ncbi:uncharacterized protein C8Q71DRAFT_758301 [Rhodofomes roseus]|uniref:BZIP domain-containing protein n=1 Tax=Rhodofomes roseus TaxID=34475 RepID=A0ABQ8KG29_9APHY|nr:uncharacterized protein C8Q71DRAFT_758301 [Rhodofomes roseus]KAH9836515.1 hypothetical protein C8Q71DRAFT_758301 [Rhodofomes roseus]